DHEDGERVDEDAELDVEPRGARVVPERGGVVAALGGVAEQVDEQRHAAGEGERDRHGADQAGGAAGKKAEAERGHDAAQQRKEQDEPCPGGGAHPRSSRRSSTSSGRRRRYSATIRPKTWPSWSPSMRLKATRARFPALSISSRQSRITIRLRRISTPTAPTAKSSAESTRYHS